MHRFDTLEDYLNAGRMRLRDAQELLEQPSYYPDDKLAATRHLRGAVYLAGYAVECALKAYIITRAGTETFSEAPQTNGAAGDDLFRGKRSHNLKLLLDASGLEAGLDLSPSLGKAWAYCRKWTTDHRYDPKMWTTRIDAKKSVDAMARFSAWVDEQRQII